MSGADGTTHLPPALQKFFQVVLGMEWPEADEGGLRELRGAWSSAASAAEEFAESVGVDATVLAEALHGALGDQVAGYLRGDVVAGVGDLVSAMRELSHAAETAAADVQKAKIMLIAMAALALATVISLLYSLIFSFMIPAVEAAAQVGLRLVLRELAAKIASLSVRGVGVATAKLGVDAAKWGAFGGAFMGGLDGGIQLGQIAAGRRHGFDWESLKGSVIGGVIGGAVGGVAHGLSRGVVSGLSAEVRGRVSGSVRALGHFGYASAQVASAGLSNPLINVATGMRGNVWDGIIGAASRADGVRAGGGGVADLKVPDFKIPSITAFDGLPAYRDLLPDGGEVAESESKSEKDADEVLSAHSVADPARPSDAGEPVGDGELQTDRAEPAAAGDATSLSATDVSAKDADDADKSKQDNASESHAVPTALPAAPDVTSAPASTATGFASGREWADVRDAVTPTRHAAERFEAVRDPKIEHGQIEGRITQIRFDLRRATFTGEDGTVHTIREATAPISLRAKDPTAAAAYAARVQGLLDTHFNHRHRYSNGDQAHFSVSHTPDNGEHWSSNPHDAVPITLSSNGDARTDQLTWHVDRPEHAVHEVFHFFGLADTHADSQRPALLGRADEPGIMGAAAGLELGAHNLEALDGATSATHTGHPAPDVVTYPSPPEHELHGPVNAPATQVPRTAPDPAAVQLAVRAKIDLPLVFGKPEFGPVRAALGQMFTASGKDGKWVSEQYADRVLLVLADTLNGVRRIYDDAFDVRVQVVAIGPARDTRAGSADFGSTHTAESATRSAKEVERTPVDPSKMLDVPAGPVTVSGRVAGIGAKSSSGAAVRKAEGLRIDAHRETETVESVHEVVHRITVEPRGRRLSRRGRHTAPEIRDVPVTMTLAWPKRIDPALQSPRSVSSSYAEIEPGSSPADRQQAYARFERERRAIKQVVLAGIGDVFDRVKDGLRLDLADPETARLRSWLDSLGPEHGRDIVTGGLVRRTFTFDHRRHPVEIVLGRAHLPHRPRRPSEHVESGRRSISHRHSTSAEHRLSEGGTREWGGEIAVGVGESLAEAIGVTLSGGVSYRRSAEDTGVHTTELQRDLDEQTTGDLDSHDIELHYLVSMSDARRPSTPRSSGSPGFSRGHAALPAPITVPGAARLSVARKGEMSSDTDDAGTGGSVASLRGPSGLRLEEVPGHVSARWTLTRETLEDVTGRVVHRLAATGLIPGSHAAKVTEDLRQLLTADAQSLLDGGDGLRLPLPGAAGDLFLRGNVEASKGRYVKAAAWKELAGRISARDFHSFESLRRRSKGFHVSVEGGAGTASLSGEIGPSRTKERRGSVSQSVETEQTWSGRGGPSYLYQFPVEIEVRTGAGWHDLDAPMKWDDGPVSGRLEIAVPARPGKGVDVVPEDVLPETGWTRGAPLPPMRPGTLPAEHVVDSVSPVRHLVSTATEMLVLTAEKGLGKEAKALVQRLVFGDEPANLGGRAEDEATAASRAALETWGSWSSRQGRLAVAAGPADELPLRSYNDGGPLGTGSRDLTGDVRLTTTYGNPRIIDRNDAQTFGRTQHRKTVLMSGESAQNAVAASFEASVKAGERFTGGGGLSADYSRGPMSSTTDTVDLETSHSRVERGYLVEFDAHHHLATSVGRSRTGPFGGRHEGHVSRQERDKFVPRAVKVWVTASDLPRIGELTSHDLDRNVHPDDRAAYHAVQTPAPTSSPVVKGHGPVEPARPEVVTELKNRLREELRKWENEITDREVAAQYSQLHDALVQSFGTRLVLGGFGTMLTDMLHGGTELLGERLGESGKLEQLVVVSARRVDGRVLGADDHFRHQSKVTTTRHHVAGKRSSFNWGVKGSAVPDVGAPEGWVGSQLSGLLDPNAAVEGRRTSEAQTRKVHEQVVTYTWAGRGVRHEFGIEVQVRLRPWAHSGQYRRHLPGLRHTPVQDTHTPNPFTIPAAIRTTVAVPAAAAPLATVDGSLRETLPARGIPLESTLRAWPFPAPKLHAELVRLADGLSARRGASLLVGTRAGQLSNYFAEALSGNGHVVTVGSRQVDSVTIRMDLGRREVVTELPGATLTNSASRTGHAVTEVTGEAGAEAAIAGGLAESLVPGLSANLFNLNVFDENEVGSSTSAAKPSKVYLVRAELSSTITVTPPGGPARPAVSTGPDGEVWLRADEAGLEALGLKPVVPSTPASSPGIPVSPRMRSAVLRPAPSTGLTTAYRDVSRGAGEIVLSPQAQRAWVDELTTLGSGALEQRDLPSGTGARLADIDGALAVLKDASVRTRVRSLVNDAVLVTSLAPLSYELRGGAAPRVFRPVSPLRLTQLLDDVRDRLHRGENPFDGPLLRGLDHDPAAPLVVRLATLATLNLSARARTTLAKDPLFTALLAAPPVLGEALFAAAGHETQHRDTTAEIAVVNTALRSRVPTIAALLQIGRAAVRSREDFAALNERAFALVTAGQPDAAAWRELTDRWSRTVQDLAPDRYQAVVRSQLAQELNTGTERPGGGIAVNGRLGTATERIAFWNALAEGSGQVLHTADGRPVHVRALLDGPRRKIVVSDPAERAARAADLDGFAVEVSLREYRAPAQLFTADTHRRSGIAVNAGVVLGGNAGERAKAETFPKAGDGAFAVLLGSDAGTATAAVITDSALVGGWNGRDGIRVAGPDLESMGDAALEAARSLGVWVDLPASAADRVASEGWVRHHPDGEVRPSPFERAHTPIRAGAFFGQDNALAVAEMLPAEKGVFAVVPGPGAELSAQDVVDAVQATAGEWRGVRLFVSDRPGLAELAAEVSAELGVPVARPAADLHLGFGDAGPVVRESASQPSDWLMTRPDGQEADGPPYALERPADAEEAFGLPAPVRLTAEILPGERDSVPMPPRPSEVDVARPVAASWFDPSGTPLRPVQWEHLRASVDVRTVDTERFDPFISGSPTADELAGQRHLVRYDVRRMQVGSRFVREFTVRLRLHGATPELEAAVHSGVDSVVNAGHRLPGGDQLHVRVEFVRPDESAHADIRTRPRDSTLPSDQLHWRLDDGPSLAHEVLHFVGLSDEHVDARRVFLRDSTLSRVESDGGPMGPSVHIGATLKPRHAWLIERTLVDQLGPVESWNPVDAPPLESLTRPDTSEEHVPMPPRPADGELLTDSTGRATLLSYLSAESRAAVGLGHWSGGNDHSYRVLEVTGTAGARWEVPSNWAHAVDDTRESPRFLLLEARHGTFAGPAPSAVAMAARMAGDPGFARLNSAHTQAPLVVLVADDTAAPGRNVLSGQFAEHLQSLTGWAETYHYQGPVKISEVGAVSIPLGGAVGTVRTVTPADLRWDEQGGVFDFVDDGSRVHRFPAEITDPLVVSLDGAVSHARFDRRGGGRLELDGAQFGRVLLQIPDFRDALVADPTRPVVLTGGPTGQRNNHSGFGFDLAGALRTAGHFNDVHAPVRRDDGVLNKVSGLRDGDLRIEAVHDAEGRIAAVLVRSPGDHGLLEGVRNWARQPGGPALGAYAAPGGLTVAAPWSGRPGVVFARPDADGHLVLRSDGTPLQVGTAELARVLGDGSLLRDMLGIGTRGETARGLAKPVLFAPIAGRSEPDAAAFAEGIFTGGFARTVFAPRGELTVTPAGLVLDGPGFDQAAPRRPGSADLVHHPMVNRALGVHGQFFPARDFDAVNTSVSATRGNQRQHYYVMEPGGQARSYVLPAPASTWVVAAHADPHGMEAVLATNRPHQRGDSVNVGGDELARIVRAGELFLTHHRGAVTHLRVLNCSFNARTAGGGPTPAEALHRAWGAGEPVLGSLLAANARVDVDAGGDLWVDGGTYTDVTIADDPLVSLGELAITGEYRTDLFAPGHFDDEMRQLVQNIARGAAWRARRHAVRPFVDIVGHGVNQEHANERTAEVNAAFARTFATEAARLERIGLPVTPQDVELVLSPVVLSSDSGHPLAFVVAHFPVADVGYEAVMAPDIVTTARAFADLRADLPVPPDAPPVVTALRDASGRPVGVAFLNSGEAHVARAAADLGAFTVAVHHGADGFRVPLHSGGVRTVDAEGMIRELSSLDTTRFGDWRRSPALTFLSCRLGAPEHRERLSALEVLARGEGFTGTVSTYRGRVEVRPDGTVRSLEDDERVSIGAIVLEPVAGARFFDALPRDLRTGENVVVLAGAPESDASQTAAALGADVLVPLESTAVTPAGQVLATGWSRAADGTMRPDGAAGWVRFGPDGTQRHVPVADLAGATGSRPERTA
ncbi:WXG100-like domain-containing protein [Lentzea cavernae]|uniref:Outer membrane channel protein CpnT-like N-terminal domain-containing protein n=1 Tax=Lentzea cavernae TaxID=2020703 RepID=A0ABQ3MTH9_9PSEU|nr:hypothetical protein [Lentzea cavernae]GHH56528.1 hypothetical protein GCM10017774_74760 [Lentzea cavernae]